MSHFLQKHTFVYISCFICQYNRSLVAANAVNPGAFSSVNPNFICRSHKTLFNQIHTYRYIFTFCFSYHPIYLHNPDLSIRLYRANSRTEGLHILKCVFRVYRLQKWCRFGASTEIRAKRKPAREMKLDWRSGTKRCRLKRERCIFVIEKAPNAYRASRLSTGAGEGNRTLVFSLGSWRSAIEPHLRLTTVVFYYKCGGMSRCFAKKNAKFRVRSYSRPPMVSA